jgi:hypothetical protein
LVGSVFGSSNAALDFLGRLIGQILSLLTEIIASYRFHKNSLNLMNAQNDPEPT